MDGILVAESLELFLFLGPFGIYQLYLERNQLVRILQVPRITFKKAVRLETEICQTRTFTFRFKNDMNLKKRKTPNSLSKGNSNDIIKFCVDNRSHLNKIDFICDQIKCNYSLSMEKLIDLLYFCILPYREVDWTFFPCFSFGSMS